MTDTDVAILGLLLATLMFVIAGASGLIFFARGWFRNDHTDARIERML